MLIKVTQEDINKGKKHNCNECPVALAIKRIINDKYIKTHKANLSIDSVWYPLPSIVVKFISDFDKGIMVKPFEFELNL